VPASVPGRTERRWGWHRLADTWACRVVDLADVRPGELVLDIGAGDGALTAPLLAAGAHVIAVELHAGRRAALRDRFGTARLTVVGADAAELRLPRRPFRVVANPPYAAWASLLRRLMSHGSRLRAADLVLPRPVANRYANGRAPGAGRWARDYVVQRGILVPRNAFVPPPPRDSAMLVIRRR
jgi:23S rRNA (adenine-N6)-dimethyltransferase